MTTKAQLQDQLDQAEKNLKRQAAAHKRFQKKVVTVALQKTAEHGWCEVVAQALHGMKLDEFMPVNHQIEVQAPDSRGWESYDGGDRCTGQSLADAKELIANAIQSNSYYSNPSGTKYRIVVRHGYGKATVLAGSEQTKTVKTERE